MTDSLLISSLKKQCQLFGAELTSDVDCFCVTLKPSALLQVMQQYRDDEAFLFDTLIDICGVDYLHYGMSEWQTQDATETGFSRAILPLDQQQASIKWTDPRYAVVYHLLSTTLNQRLRVRVMVEEVSMAVPSVVSVWPAANWFEREAYDLFGIIFDGHPDLRRILTDYGFVGHPFRKDFPLVGEVEMRYDATEGRCVYEPVSIKPRVQVPKVIRQDQRDAQMKEC